MPTSYQRPEVQHIYPEMKPKTKDNNLPLPDFCQCTDLVKLGAEYHTGDVLNMGNIRSKGR